MKWIRKIFGHKKPNDHLRSHHWPTVRAAHLRKEPCCQVCGAETHLNVHHIEPFHLHPGLELEQSNLITLCEGTDGGCHLRFGHLWNWHSYNAEIHRDAATWRRKKAHRP